MSYRNPGPNWFHAPTGAERVWIALALLWCVVLSIAMPFWHVYGKQNSAGKAAKTTPAEYLQRVTSFVQANTVETRNEVPVVQGTPGGDVYLLAKTWQWYPILKMKAGQTYRLHISSYDLQHGFSLVPLNMNFQVVPGYDHILEITPDRAGTYQIICNEFCGIGHHQMTGMIIVE